MRILRDRRGSYTVEAVLFLPFVFVIFFSIIWGGMLMYTWTGVNYAAMSAAVDAARRGEFSSEVRDAAASYLRQWTPGGKMLGVDASASAPYRDPNRIVVWGPPPGAKVNRGGNIQVGIVYPAKIDSPLLAFLGRSFFGGDVLYLQASAVAKSEVYFE